MDLTTWKIDDRTLFHWRANKWERVFHYFGPVPESILLALHEYVAYTNDKDYFEPLTPDEIICRGNACALLQRDDFNLDVNSLTLKQLPDNEGKYIIEILPEYRDQSWPEPLLVKAKSESDAPHVFAIRYPNVKVDYVRLLSAQEAIPYKL